MIVNIAGVIGYNANGMSESLLVEFKLTGSYRYASVCHTLVNSLPKRLLVSGMPS